MITAIHISIALASTGYLAYMLFASNVRTLLVAYLSVVATVGSGVVLMFVRPETMAHVCVSGLVYLVASLAVISYVRRRSAKFLTATK